MQILSQARQIALVSSPYLTYLEPIATSYSASFSTSFGIISGGIPRSQSSHTIAFPFASCIPRCKALARPPLNILLISLTFGFFNSCTTLQVPSGLLSSTIIISSNRFPRLFEVLSIASTIVSFSLYEGKTTETLKVSLFRPLFILIVFLYGFYCFNNSCYLLFG